MLIRNRYQRINPVYPRFKFTLMKQPLLFFPIIKVLAFTIIFGGLMSCNSKSPSDKAVPDVSKTKTRATIADVEAGIRQYIKTKKSLHFPPVNLPVQNLNTI